MADLKTKYLGLELKNPVILGANNLVTNIDNIRKAEDAGASAYSLRLHSLTMNLMNIPKDMPKW